MTNVQTMPEMAKTALRPIMVDGFTAEWDKDIFRCFVYEQDDSVSQEEIVTMDEVYTLVTNEKGQVDASFYFRDGNEAKTIEQYISFQEYLDYCFHREGERVLASIINKRRAALC